MLTFMTELDRISDVIIEGGIISNLKDDVDYCDAGNLSTEERLMLAEKYVPTINEAALKLKIKINQTVLILYLNYIFGTYWNCHKDLRKACSYHFPKVKNVRTYGVRGEVDYLRAVSHRNILQHTNDAIDELEKNSFRDPGGQVSRRLELLRTANDIVSKQPQLRYEIESDGTLDTPEWRDIDIKNVVNSGIESSLEILNRSNEDD